MKLIQEYPYLVNKSLTQQGLLDVRDPMPSRVSIGPKAPFIRCVNYKAYYSGVEPSAHIPQYV
jgi:hypothetical protein